MISPNPRTVGRSKINDEQMPGRFPLGTLARMKAVLRDKEKKADFLREAVEAELTRRERLAKRKAKPSA